MPRIPRMLVSDEKAVYHVMTRTALPGFPLKSEEKDYLLHLIKDLSRIYFTKVLGFCIMGNHFHLLLKMFPEEQLSNGNIKKRLVLRYGNNVQFSLEQIKFYRSKFSNLSEFIKEIKQTFSRYYNKRNNRKGFFWGERFKSQIVEKGETLIHCLAYIDLNPIRAGIVEKPENYRWSSLGYHIQTGNKDGFLSLDFGLYSFRKANKEERLRRYRQYVYETGAVKGRKGKKLNVKHLERERRKNFQITRTDRFFHRTRYFSDSGIIGTRAFVEKTYQQFKHFFQSKNDKKPNPIKGLEGIFALKRLAE